jgi:hypothetical protein
MSFSLPSLPDAIIAEIGALPDRLEGATKVGPYSEARPGAVLRIVPGLARFLARDGNRIDYAMEAGGDREAIRPLLQGALCAALIHQRGELPLHAATLVTPGGRAAVAVAGDKGAGKSTLSFALVRRGWTLLNDDLTRVTLDGGRPVAWPGRGGIRLHEDSCGRFGLPLASLARIPGDPAKCLVEIPAATGGPRPLGAVVLIDRGRGRAGIERLRGAEAAMLLSRNVYRPAYVGPLGMGAALMGTIGRTAAACAVARLALDASPEEIADSLAPLVDQAEAC